MIKSKYILKYNEADESFMILSYQDIQKILQTITKAI